MIHRDGSVPESARMRPSLRRHSGKLVRNAGYSPAMRVRATKATSTPHARFTNVPPR